MASVSSVVPLTTGITHQSQPPKLPNVSFSIRASSYSALVSNSNGCIEARFGSLRSGGTNVLERPNFDQSQFDPATQVQEGGDIGRVKDKKTTGSGDSYKVLLIDDARHTEKLVAVVKTSWTNINPGRRFYGCPDSPSDCPFVDWMDPPMCPRSVNIIPGLLRSLNNNRRQIQVLEEERARMKKYLYVSWALVFMVVVYNVLA